MPSLWYRRDRGIWVYECEGKDGRTHRYQVGRTKSEALRAVRQLEERLARQGTEAKLTLKAESERWLKERERDPDLVDHRHNRIHLKNHILPAFGDRDPRSLSPREIAQWVKDLRRKPLRPKTVRNIHGTLHALCSWLEFDGVLNHNPASLGRRRLPRASAIERVEHRQKQTCTRAEVEALISDLRVPWDRRVLYALAYFTAARRAEAVAMLFRDYDERATPLGQITICRTYGRSDTKTQTPRPVPVHPTLAAVLAEWKLRGFEQHTKQKPGPEDPIVPREGGTARSPGSMWDQFQQDLKALELRTRGVHALRRAFESHALAAGARRELIRTILHTSDRDITDVYHAPEWADLCDAVLKLDIRRRRSDEVGQLAAVSVAS